MVVLVLRVLALLGIVQEPVSQRMWLPSNGRPGRAACVYCHVCSCARVPYVACPAAAPSLARPPDRQFAVHCSPSREALAPFHSNYGGKGCRRPPVPVSFVTTDWRVQESGDEEEEDEAYASINDLFKTREIAKPLMGGNKSMANGAGARAEQHRDCGSECSVFECASNAP